MEKSNAIRRSVLSLSILLLNSHASLDAQGAAFIEHTLTNSFNTPTGITIGPDGALWFSDAGLSSIGRLTTEGSFTSFTMPSGSNANDITTGPDGALWFLDWGLSSIGRITTEGAVTEYKIPTAGPNPRGITTGSDGALWFTEASANKIGRITTAGIITEFPVPTSRAFPGGITAGPDGALWFTEGAVNKIGRITTAGRITEYRLPTANAGPNGITAGPDGALWFAEFTVYKIGRITTAGAITEYPTATTEAGPVGITTGRDGALWFTEDGVKTGASSKIGRMTTAGAASDYRLPNPDRGLGAIVYVLDRGFWFVETTANQIGQLVFPTATLTLSPDTGSPGFPVSLTGSGFAAGENVNLYANSTGTNLLGTVPVDSSGAFSVVDQVGAVPFGYGAVVGVGRSSGRLGVAPFTVTAELIVTPNAGTAGSTAAVGCYGLVPDQPVKVYWSTARLQIGGGKTDASGSFAMNVTIPADAAPGTYAVSCDEPLSLLAAQSNFTVQ